MPDSFFASNKTRKRKRTLSNAPQNNGNTSTRASSSKRPSGRSAPPNGTSKRKKIDEELASDATDDENAGDIDDMDLRADSDPGLSAEEDDDETPAEKRLRLAKLYLQSVKDGIGESFTNANEWSDTVPDDGNYDAAEIDKELISTRLRQDVLEHSGKIHRFIADSVRYLSL
jgi:ribosomal RNA-processing protein 9